MLSCFGGGGFGLRGCSDNCGCDNNRRSSERAGVRNLRDRDCGCDCACESERERAEAREERAERRAERAEAREERAERRAERAERRADNNSCDASDMVPPRWQDFPGVSHSSPRDDCGCDN